jgi:hypothetical protein
MVCMTSTLYQKMRARLSALYGLSIYGALLLVVFGGLRCRPWSAATS